MWRSRQLYARLVWPPTNQRKVGKSQSKTRSQGRNQGSCPAARAQKPSGSSAASRHHRRTIGLTSSISAHPSRSGLRTSGRDVRASLGESQGRDEGRRTETNRQGRQGRQGDHRPPTTDHGARATEGANRQALAKSTTKGRQGRGA